MYSVIWSLYHGLCCLVYTRFFVNYKFHNKYEANENHLLLRTESTLVRKRFPLNISHFLCIAQEFHSKPRLSNIHCSISAIFMNQVTIVVYQPNLKQTPVSGHVLGIPYYVI